MAAAGPHNLGGGCTRRGVGVGSGGGVAGVGVASGDLGEIC